MLNKKEEEEFSNLFENLINDDLNVRKKATLTLEEINGVEAILILLKSFSSQNTQTSTQSMNSLEKMLEKLEGKNIIEKLQEALTDLLMKKVVLEKYKKYILKSLESEVSSFTLTFLTVCVDGFNDGRRWAIECIKDIVKDEQISESIILEIGDKLSGEQYEKDIQDARNGIDKREIKVLVQKLKSEDEDVEGTIKALEKFGEQIISPLKELVNHKNERIKKRVIHLLENYQLLKQLESENIKISKESAEALAKRGNKRGLDKLFEIFSSSLYDRECYYNSQDLFDILMNLNEKERLVEVLLERLEKYLKYDGLDEWYESRNEVALAIIEILILTKDADALVSTLNYFGHNSTFDNRVIDAMIELNDKRVIKPLIDALSHDYWEIKVAVLRALSHFGLLTAIQPIIQQLSFAHSKVRKAAKTALIDFDMNDDMHKALTKMIEGKDQKLRFSAVMLLGYKGDKQVVPYLKEFTIDEDRNRVMVAIDVLDELGELGTKEIYSFLDTYFEENVWFGGYAGSAELIVKTLPLLEKILETQIDEFTESEDDFKPIQVVIDENWMHQIVEIICSLKIEKTQRLKAIKIFLEDAKRILNEQEAWEEMMDAIKEIGYEIDETSDYIDWTWQTLKKVIEKYGELSIKPIITVMKNTDSKHNSKLKLALVYTLGEVKDKRAVESLTMVSNDTNEHWQMRKYAAEALIKLNDKVT